MSRKVKRVLVMLDYGPDDAASGEVFDLTALVSEMLPQATYRASISLSVQASKSYKPEPLPQIDLEIVWGGDAGNWVHGATHLEDVINSAMPDGERVAGIKKKKKRLEDKVQSLGFDAMRAKLEQVASIRHQHPIARVSETVPVLNEANP